MKFKIECTVENAPKFAEWLKTRGGLKKWVSINLGNMDAGWTTPNRDVHGHEVGKPSWQCANEPEIVTSSDDVGVYTEELFKAFPVALRRGSGFSSVLTDAAQRKLDKVMDQCREKHGSASYRRGVLDIEGASMGVYYQTGIISLTDHMKTLKGVTA